MENISPAVALGAGLFSFLSPCVLPLVPVYLASLCGSAAVFEPGVRRIRLPLFFHSLSFVVGFSIIFTVLGAIAGITGFAVNLSPLLLGRIAGSLLVAFGLFMLVALKVPWLNYEKRLNLSFGQSTNYLRSLLIGAVFSLTWTPCVGPWLGSIITLAWSTETAWRGAYLLAVYSLGLGIPFLIIGAAFDYINPLIRRIYCYSSTIYMAGSALLIIMGILILTNRLSWFYVLS